MYTEDCAICIEGPSVPFIPTNFSTLAVEVTRQLYSVLPVPEQTKLRKVAGLPTKNTGWVPPLHETVPSLPG